MIRAIQPRRDDGFTVVELVIAAAILFFVMTALVGVLGASTQMTASAKGRSILTNTIASELEQIRTLSMEDVAYDTAGGSIPHTKVLATKDGITVTLSYTITDRTSQNKTKEVTVRGVAARPGFAPVRFTSFAVFRDRIGGGQSGGNTGAPRIEFTSNTPAAGTPLEGKKIGRSSTDISIEARAWSDSGANIVAIEYSVDGIDNSTGSKASLPLKSTNSVYPGAISRHEVSPASPDTTWAFAWHTGQKDTEGLPEIRDGIRTVTIIARDDQNRTSAPVKRWFLVDNFAPTTAPAVTLVRTPNSDFTQSLSLSWKPVLDGDYSADHYDWKLYKKTNDSSSLDYTADWDSIAVPTSSAKVPVQPLAYYVGRVQPLSILGKDPDISPWGMSAPILTSPILSGTHDIARTSYNASNDTWKFTSRFKLDKPDVPATVTSVIMERTGGGTAATNIDITSAAKSAWAAGPSYDFENIATQTIRKSSTPIPPEYRLTVTLTPGGTTTSMTASSQYAKCQVPNVAYGTPEASLSYVQRW